MSKSTPGQSPSPPVESIAVPNRELLELAARFVHGFARSLDGKGDQLPYLRLRLLEVLHCQGPAMMKDLAADLGLSARNMTTLADGLEHEGLIRRVAHPSDRRVTLLELTPAGNRAAECSLAPRLAEIGQLFEPLTATQKKHLADCLEVLVAELG